MDWLFDNPKVFLLVAVVAFSLIKRVLESKKAAENSPADDEDPFESWEPVPQRQAPSVPPPLVRGHIPQLRGRSIPPTPPLPSREPDTSSLLKRQQDMMDRLQHAKDIKAAMAAKGTKATTTGGAAATQGRVSRAGKSAATTGQGLRGRLRNRSEIRKAIIMREILDRPVGLR
jgi:hypothetical protein